MEIIVNNINVPVTGSDRDDVLSDAELMSIVASARFKEWVKGLFGSDVTDIEIRVGDRSLRKASFRANVTGTSPIIRDVTLTFVVINDDPVCVTSSVDDKHFAAALASPKFDDWRTSIDPRLIVHSVDIQSVDLFGPTNVGFLKLKADITKDGKFVPGICFIRGDSVGILVVLRCEGLEYLLLTVQPRPAVGSAGFVEIPAGMVDASGKFVGQAAVEIEQETGYKITETDLTDLSTSWCGSPSDPHDGAGADDPVSYALSPGGCDECMQFFLHRRDVTPDELTALEGKATGVIEEGEVIKLKVTLLDRHARRIPDGKTQIALGLYRELQLSELLAGRRLAA